MQIITIITAAGPIGISIFVILLCMSVCSIGIMISKYFHLRSTYNKAMKGLEGFEEAKSLQEAIQSLGSVPSSPLFAVAQHGVKEFNRSKDAHVHAEIVVDNVRRSLHQGINNQVNALNVGLSFLATAANTAPFIGLLGTVWGIMNSFHSISMMKSAAISTVAPGISEALLATAVGLFVAIPAAVAYNMFLGKISRIENALINFAGTFLNSVQRELHSNR